MQEYPRWKYHQTEPAVIVQDADEDKALGKAWHNDPALANPSPAHEYTEEERQELLVLADTLGVKVGKTWKAETISKAVDEARAKATDHDLV